MVATVVFDQSVYVKNALETVLHEGLIGLVLTSIMILLFLGSLRATSAVLLSIPLSALAAFVVLSLMGSTINTMILGGLALAFSRVIDNSVISLENIYRHLEMGALPAVAAEVGGAEVNLAVLAATLVDVVDFLPGGIPVRGGQVPVLGAGLGVLPVAAGVFRSGDDGDSAVLLALPQSRSRTLQVMDRRTRYEIEPTAPRPILVGQVQSAFNRGFNKVLDFYEYWVRRALEAAGADGGRSGGRVPRQLRHLSLPGLGLLSPHRCRTVHHQPQGAHRHAHRNDQRVRGQGGEPDPASVVDPRDFKMMVSNIGVVPDFSALYTTNAGPYTATIQVQLRRTTRRSSFEYMDQVQEEIARQYPEIRTFFSSGSMVDAILNMGMPAPIDVQVSSSDLEQSYGIAENLARQIRRLKGVGQVYIPQDMNYPALRLDVDRVHAGELGLSQKDIVDNVITALNSNLMIAPNYWVDRKTGNDYFLTVQYFENGHPPSGT